MRFTISHWLCLLLTCIAASAAMAVVSRASWAAILPIISIGFAGSENILFAVALTLGLLYMPLNALAAWPVLRSCVNGLRFAPWLAETGLGAALAGVVSIPANGDFSRDMGTGRGA